MPLANFSGDPQQDYFADGMTEALITDLAQIKALKVISRTSVMHYKGTQKTTKEIANELKVENIVEGSVVRSGNRVRITAQLIQASTDQHLWANSYERDIHDILSLQSEVAMAVAREIKATLTPDEAAHLSQNKTIDPEVHESYLKGRYFWSKGTQKDLERSVEYFKQGLAKDPQNSFLYSGLAAAYASFADYYLAPADVMPKSKEAALKAVQYDKDNSDAFVALGRVQFLNEYDFAQAERSFQRALQLNTNNADACDLYALLFSVLKRNGEAYSMIKKAYDLDPLSPLINNDAIWIAYVAHDNDKALEYGQKWIQTDPNNPFPYFNLSIAYAAAGDTGRAIELAQKSVQLDDSPMYKIALAQQLAIGGRKKDAANLLDELIKISPQHYVCPYEMGIIFLRLGEMDRCFEWLERSYNERSICIIFLQSDPRLESIRSDPRYIALWKKMNYPSS